MNKNQSDFEDPLTLSERARSNFVRNFVQGYTESSSPLNQYKNSIPKKIVQFWDDLNNLPIDVKECMDSWKKLEESGYEIEIFDEVSAREFIRTNLGSRFEDAFIKCYHPSMKSDYFRYGYIYLNGGFYVDADDVFYGGSIDHHFEDGRLKLQPFCYDMESSKMVSPSDFIGHGANSPGWIFYFNTTPLFASRKHPIIEKVLMSSTDALEQAGEDELPEVQATTGPGILTESIWEVLSQEIIPEGTMRILHDWEQTSESKWSLS